MNVYSVSFTCHRMPNNYYVALLRPQSASAAIIVRRQLEAIDFKTAGDDTFKRILKDSAALEPAPIDELVANRNGCRC